MRMDNWQLKRESVCAIIISYDGGNTIIETINAIRDQVDYIIIIDNNSNTWTKEVLRLFSDDENIEIIYNSDNFGIAYALNQGVLFSYQRGFKWVLTMDQDSIAEENMVSEMLNCALICQDNVVSISPTIVCNDEKSSEFFMTMSPKYEERLTVITSGNLVKTKMYEMIGGYNENLFIDSVDFDFCLRLQKSGYKIARCTTARLFHSLGRTEKMNILGINISIIVHSPLRKYYIMRNHIYMLKRYFVSFPIFCIKQHIGVLFLIIKIILFEKAKMQSLKYIFIGLFHGLNNRYGIYR
ncbi:MAG: glycosyltransferase [Veillonellales bacterium]